MIYRGCAALGTNGTARHGERGRARNNAWGERHARRRANENAPGGCLLVHLEGLAWRDLPVYFAGGYQYYCVSCPAFRFGLCKDRAHRPLYMGGKKCRVGLLHRTAALNKGCVYSVARAIEISHATCTHIGVSTESSTSSQGCGGDVCCTPTWALCKSSRSTRC